MTPAVSQSQAQALPPAPWIIIAPGKRLALALDGPARSLRVSLQDAPSEITRGFSGLRRSLRRRVGMSMLDFYPVARVPLYVSGGARTLGRYTGLIDAIDRRFRDDTRLSADGRSNSAMLRAPSAMVGYSHVVADRLLLGVEGGGLLNASPGHRPAGAAQSLIPGQFLNNGRATLDPMMAVYLSAAF